MNWIENCQNWKLPKLENVKIESDFSISFLKLVCIFDELSLKLPKLKVVQIWMLPIGSDLYISCHKLTVLMN